MGEIETVAVKTRGEQPALYHQPSVRPLAATLDGEAGASQSVTSRQLGRWGQGGHSIIIAASALQQWSPVAVQWLGRRFEGVAQALAESVQGSPVRLHAAGDAGEGHCLRRLVGPGLHCNLTSARRHPAGEALEPPPRQTC